MKEMASLSIIESNGNLRWLQKENLYFCRTITCSKNFTKARKLKKNGFQSRAGVVKSQKGAKNFPASHIGRKGEPDRKQHSSGTGATSQTFCHFIQMCREHDPHCAINACTPTLHWAYNTIRRRRSSREAENIGNRLQTSKDFDSLIIFNTERKIYS